MDGDRHISHDGLDLLQRDHDLLRARLGGLVHTGDAFEKWQLFEQVGYALAVHESVEEALVYPSFLRDVAEGPSDVVDRRVAEEQACEELLMQMEDMDPEGGAFAEACRRLAHTVVAHVRQEERKVFPALRRREAAGGLDSIGEVFEALREPSPKRGAAHEPIAAVLARTRRTIATMARGIGT